MSLLSRRALLLSVLSLVPLAACSTRPPAGEEDGPPPDLPPLPDVRRIVLSHPKSRERVDVIYFHSGAYDPRALQQIDQLLRDRRTGQVGRIDPLLMDFMFDLLQRTGLPPTTVVEVTDGFRSPGTNADLVRDNANAARESYHLQGRAMDFKVPLLPGAALGEIAKTMQRGGAAYYPSTGHTHIDTGPNRTWKTR
ncbi:YcbK family protein [Niveispirillum sp. KHB5.9]|uniref:YcbK family protein n=1 Tax=Niveispirillum sp. KHB5.9 TaxID=3400269 RepID=UPI003A85A1C0